MIGRVHNISSTVSELMAATLLADADLLAGGGGLHRPVQRVQWVEVLDDKADHFAEGDLLLTTAYNLRDDPELQHGLAAQMLAFGVSAVVIKCGYYLDRVPPPVLAAADRLDLPILELDRSVAFVEVAQSIYGHLTARSTARLRRSAAIHRDLVQLVVDGAGLERLVERAAGLLGTPLAITGEAGEMLARAPAGFVPGGTSRAFPVVAQGRRLATLWADGGDDLVEQVAAVTALVVAPDRNGRGCGVRQLQGLVLDLVSAAPGEAAELAVRARRLGVGVPDDTHVAVVEAADPESAVELRGQLAQTLEPGSLLACRAAQVVVLASGSGLEPLEDGGLGRACPQALAGGCSGPAAGLAELAGHHRRAVRAARIGRALDGSGRLCRYARIEAYDALLGDGDSDRLDRISARVLDPLSPDLRVTLRVLTGCGGSVSAAARRLFLHRNTVRYRVRRIEQLTGLRLDRGEDRLLCELALLHERMSTGDGPAAPVAAASGRHRG